MVHIYIYIFVYIRVEQKKLEKYSQNNHALRRDLETLRPTTGEKSENNSCMFAVRLNALNGVARYIEF